MNTDSQATFGTPDESAEMTHTRSWWHLYLRRKPDALVGLLDALEIPTDDREKIMRSYGIRLSDYVSQHPQKE